MEEQDKIIQEQVEYMRSKYDLLSPTFKDNKILLKVVRKVILGIELSPTEKDLYKQVPQIVVDEIANRLVYDITGDEETFNIPDFWYQFNLKDRTEYQVNIDIQYLAFVKDFLTDGIKRLNGKEAQLKFSDIQYSKTATREENIVNVIARNVILSTVEGALKSVYHLANTKPLTIEQVKAQIQKNSSK